MILAVSLPSRERGLKSALLGLGYAVSSSLPSRERGLKLVQRTDNSTGAGSLPSRERGLKYAKMYSSQFACLVAPFAGAWIEIGL